MQVKEALKNNPQDARYDGYYFEPNGLLRYQGRMYVPNFEELRNLVWKEVHEAPYSGHLGVTKMLEDVKPLYFWKGMKGYIARFVAKCLE